MIQFPVGPTKAGMEDIHVRTYRPVAYSYALHRQPPAG